TKGMDVQLTTENLRRALEWQTVFLFNYVRNKVTHFSLEDAPSIGDYISSSHPIVGKSRDIVYALPWEGLDRDTGMPLVRMNGELSTGYEEYYRNYLTPDHLLIAGVSVPPYFGSVRNTFTWKGLQ